MTVAAEAPRHMQIHRFPSQRHLVHAAVTCLTAHAFVHMNAVIEIDKIGKTVDPVPTDRTVIAQTCAHRFQHIARRPDLLVAIHASRCWRNSCERTPFDFRVAISAVDAQPAYMMLVTEGNGLIEWYAFISHIRRPDG